MMADTLFYSPDIGVNPLLPEQESQHCVKVLRMREGAQLTVTDGAGTFYDCSLLQAHPRQCMVNIRGQREVSHKRGFSLQIAFAPTKQMDRNEWFVEKATEIGVDRFIPIVSSLSERKQIKHERLTKTAISAMKQSQQAFLPVIEEMVNIEALLCRPFEGRKFIAHCHDLPREPLSQTSRRGEDVLIMIGPEGDFSEDEIERAMAHGFEPVSLGDTRLRTETASLVATHTIHVINHLT